MIAPLLRTSEPFHYHDRVVGDLWRQLSPDATNAPAGWATLLQAVEAARHSLHLASPLLAGAAFTDALVRVLGTHRLRVYVLTTDVLAPAFDAQQKEAHAAALAKLSAAGAILQSTSRSTPSSLSSMQASQAPRPWFAPRVCRHLRRTPRCCPCRSTPGPCRKPSRWPGGVSRSNG